MVDGTCAISAADSRYRFPAFATKSNNTRELYLLFGNTFAVTWTEQRKTLIARLPRSLACLDTMPWMADFVGSFDQE
jgi:hypothetical protein